jgi:SPP1 family predicted phage head-tail adaptor
MAGLEAGTLRHYVLVQERVNVKDSHGDDQVSWVSRGFVWANLHDSSANELLTAQQVGSDVTGRAVVRFKPWLTAAMRLVYRGEHYNLRGVQRDMDSGVEYLILPYRRGLSEG